MSNFEGLEVMDLEKDDYLGDRKGNSTASCSICLDLVLDRGERSIAKLQCGHEFHLDCIGSAFNAKGAMQCPNCRKVEKGRWLFASGHRASSDYDFDAWVTEDFYDLSYSELPFGFQWCPFRGITQLTSLIEEGESQLNSYHESMGNTAYGDHHSGSSSTHACPYIALHGHPHAVQSTPSASSSDSVPENNTFPRHPTNFGGGQTSAEMLNSHSFTNTEWSESHNHNWQQQHSIPFSFLGNATEQSASQFGPRLPRNDASIQQRLGSFVHPHPHHGSGARSGSNLAASMVPPVMGDMRSHTHTTRRHGNNHIYQQSVPSSSLMSAPFPPIRRSRPRAFTLISSLTSNSSSAEVSGLYGFASVSSSANGTHHHEAESMARHFDRFYGWGSREGLTPLPWIPVEGESQWWGPFNPSQAPQSGGSFVPRANVISERAGQSHRMPRPPPSYM